jgi:hypothetical protein
MLKKVTGHCPSCDGYFEAVVTSYTPEGQPNYKGRHEDLDPGDPADIEWEWEEWCDCGDEDAITEYLLENYDE